MPIIPTSAYRRPAIYFNGHVETIWPSMVRQVFDVSYKRERLDLPDNDFVDLDWLTNNYKRLVIISHGLEGSSDRHYSKGMAKYFFLREWDALAWNCRSCSGEINRLPRFYHHGATEDLEAVINHAFAKGYSAITLVGFSMGGSLTLKYLGERFKLDHRLKSAVVFSVPCDLGSSARELDKPSKSFYRNRFLRKLRKKIELKSELFPDIVPLAPFQYIKTFEDFDNTYTAPLHGFKNAQDFYSKASSGQFISSIKMPTLIVNAQNDPFLPEGCYPREAAKRSHFVYLEMPKHGGHVGFTLFNQDENWMEIRAFHFVSEYSN